MCINLIEKLTVCLPHTKCPPCLCPFARMQCSAHTRWATPRQKGRVAIRPKSGDSGWVYKKQRAVPSRNALDCAKVWRAHVCVDEDCSGSVRARIVHDTINRLSRRRAPGKLDQTWALDAQVGATPEHVKGRTTRAPCPHHKSTVLHRAG